MGESKMNNFYENEKRYLATPENTREEIRKLKEDIISRIEELEEIIDDLEYELTARRAELEELEEELECI